MIRQIIAVTRVALETVRSRLGPSAVVVVGIACFAGVFSAMLTLPFGFMRTIAGNSDVSRAIVIASSAELEAFSFLPRETAAAVDIAPGIARDTDGKAILSNEAFFVVPANRKPDGIVSFVPVRGVGTKVLSLRPEIRLVAGRMFRPGNKELIAGVTAQEQYQGLEIGDKVALPDGGWTVVGAYKSRENSFQSRLMGDAETLLPAFRRNGFSSITVRLTAPGAFAEFSNALLTNPAIKVRVEREADYYTRISQQQELILLWISCIVGAIMGIGALFGAINTMYSAVSSREVEIATLRAIGFGGVAVIVSVLTEVLLLAFCGAAIGIFAAWALSSGATSIVMGALFVLRVSANIVTLTVASVIAIAVLGGVFPAIRAARLPVATALRGM